MSIEKVECWALFCDCCGDDFTHDYTPHFPDAHEAEQYILGIDGGVRDGKHYCEGCWYELIRSKTTSAPDGSQWPDAFP